MQGLQSRIAINHHIQIPRFQGPSDLHEYQVSIGLVGIAVEV